MAPARPYRSALRAAQARATRGRVLQAATVLFARLGYGRATMRAVASQAGVSVPTVEALFGTKARLLKAAIDVAIAGDDEPVPMLDRDWAAQARAAADPESLLATISGVIAAAQQRSAGLVLSVFEGAASDPELAADRDHRRDGRRYRVRAHGAGSVRPAHPPARLDDRPLPRLDRPVPAAPAGAR
jgi:AcrR family transcriptional regulator